MIKNYNLRLLAGGQLRSNSAWNMEVNGKDRCYKLYWLTDGDVNLIIDGIDHQLCSGNIYLISGQRIERQFCKNYFESHWIHYTPESLLMQSMLSKAEPIVSWPVEEFDWIIPALKRVPELFRYTHEDRKLLENLQADSNPTDLCQVQATLLFLVGELLKTVDEKEVKKELRGAIRFKNALDFMERHAYENPALEEIATKCHMAPNYFHKAFKKSFRQTPFEYILALRMNRAKELLIFTPMTVKEISVEIGYKNEFHFSKSFKKVTGLSPSHYRKPMEKG